MAADMQRSNSPHKQQAKRGRLKPDDQQLDDNFEVIEEEKHLTMRSTAEQR